jgi:hypothetical protein
MKKLLSAALLLLTVPVYAQHFEAGISGGVVKNSLHNVWFGSNNFDDFTYFQSSVITPIVTVKVIYVSKYYQLGIDAGCRTLFFKNHEYIKYDVITYQTTNNDLPVKLFLNRRLCFKHIDVYGGIYGAYIINHSHKQNTIIPGDVYNQHDNRLAAGLQIGATYFITKHVGINAEVSIEHNNYPSGPLDNNKFSFPVSLSLRYRI